ncbi:uncharacterized protein [Aegilops tauschii subsp. strangulata]|uniref:uncharacterized protein n=1 Tax=Aegilops tauschii subsp. strangulata TaxID=200361 RepID=UPI003CC8DBD4
MDQQTRDTFSWNLAGSGRYSTSSAYKAQVEGSNSCSFKATIWKVWAPGKNTMFLWLLHLNRLWCNDILQRRGWPNGYFCPLCMRNLESSVHLIWDCLTTMQVWSTTTTWGGCSALHPDGIEGQTITAKVKMIIDAAAPAARKGTKSMIALISWLVWMERNNYVFKGKLPSMASIISSCRSNMEQWRIAGATCLEHSFGHVP